MLDEAVIARSSNSILFFTMDEERRWKQHAELENIRGEIFYARGKDRFQVTTDDKIYFYRIDLETYEPALENVMYNFMHCSTMIIDSKDRFGISYKLNEPDFVVYSRKHAHNFKVALTKKNFEGAVGANLGRRGEYVLADKYTFSIHEAKSYAKRQ